MKKFLGILLSALCGVYASRLMVVPILIMAFTGASAKAGQYAVTYSGGSCEWLSGDGSGTTPYTTGSSGRAGGHGTNWGVKQTSSGPTAYSGYARCAGAITATFTWSPSYAGDQPPKNVIVFEESNAEYIKSGSGGTASIDAGLANQITTDIRVSPYGPPIGQRKTGKKTSVVSNPGTTFTLTCTPTATLSGTGAVGPPQVAGSGQASVYYKARTGNIIVSANLGNWLLASYPSPPDDIVKDGIAKIGYRDTGNPEEPPLWYWSASATYSVDASVFGSSAIHRWSALGGTISEFSDNIGVPTTGTFGQKFVDFDFGPITHHSVYSSGAVKTTRVLVGVEDGTGTSPVVVGRATVNWRPRLDILSGGGSEAEEWDPTAETISEYLRRREAFIRTGAGLTEAAYTILYGELPRSLIEDAGFLLAFKAAKLALDAARNATEFNQLFRIVGKALKQKAGFTVTSKPLLLAEGTNSSAIAAALRNLGHSQTKSVSELGGMPTGINGIDYAKLLDGHFVSAEELAQAGHTVDEAALTLGLRYEDLFGIPGKIDENIVLGLDYDLKPFGLNHIDGMAWYNLDVPGRSAFGPAEQDFWNVVNNPNNFIHFNLSGSGGILPVFDFAATGATIPRAQGYTAWELFQIKTHPELWDRIYWWVKTDQGYMPVPNPFAIGKWKWDLFVRYAPWLP